MSDSLRVKVCAIASVPRLGFQAHFGCIHSAMMPFQIPVSWGTGAFYGQTMQRLMDKVLGLGAEWLLTLDYDTLFTKRHLSRLIQDFANNPQFDALAALQVKRQANTALLHTGTADGQAQIKNGFAMGRSAHFGLTLLRADKIRALPKPWFASTPNEAGEWEEGRVDEDIHFWRQWEAAGNTCAVDCNVRVGHVEEMTRVMNENYEVEIITVSEWKKREEALAEQEQLSAVPAAQYIEENKAVEAAA